MARIDYVSQTARTVTVSYADMPAMTEVAFVNVTSGAKTPSGSGALGGGGAGTADIPIDTNLGVGQYYLLAQTRDSKEYLAQTVGFYIN